MKCYDLRVEERAESKYLWKKRINHSGTIYLNVRMTFKDSPRPFIKCNKHNLLSSVYAQFILTLLNRNFTFTAHSGCLSGESPLLWPLVFLQDSSIASMSIYGHKDALNTEENGTGMKSKLFGFIFAAFFLIAVCLVFC